MAEELRTEFAGLLGCASDHVALVPSASFGLSLAAANLGARGGRRILVLDRQFPSNVYPWRDLAAREGGEVLTVGARKGETLTEAVLAALEGRIGIVALPECHWADGRRLELARIGQAARAAGAALIIDGSQSIGALPFDLDAVRPDYLVTVSEKWLFGVPQVAYLYVDPAHHEGRPLDFNWVTRANAGDPAKIADLTDAYRPGARRVDAGARASFFTLPAALAGLRQVRAWSVDEIAATLRPLIDEIAERGQALGLDPVPPAERAPHFIGLRAPDGLPDGLARELEVDRVYVNLRGDAIRVAPHLFTSAADIDRLFAALARLLAPGAG